MNYVKNGLDGKDGYHDVIFVFIWTLDCICYISVIHISISTFIFYLWFPSQPIQ